MTSGHGPKTMNFPPPPLPTVPAPRTQEISKVVRAMGWVKRRIIWALALLGKVTRARRV